MAYIIVQMFAVSHIYILLQRTNKKLTDHKHLKINVF